ncbi:Lsr2 dimerization domain-containing protein [Brevibacterium oceani]|uniref:Lsr2 dimerization domain-containing protein n=1 Tax=Brevibacterium oceani TaxID=358099 RepID=UPI0015E73B06|nr:histone-like nucleoid-structuring protein Lsr2 [Brevibacterium oceani]
MAKRTITILSSDLSDQESEDVQTVSFGWDGRDLEIDLTAEERDEFEAGIQKYVEAARRAESGRVGSQRTRRSSGSLLSDAEKPVARLWIQEQYREREIGDRGRLPRDLEQAWIDAGKPTARN